jgi:hypothetical protein
VDTGAADVSIPLDVMTTLKCTATITPIVRRGRGMCAIYGTGLIIALTEAIRIPRSQKWISAAARIRPAARATAIKMRLFASVVIRVPVVTGRARATTIQLTGFVVQNRIVATGT